MDTMKTGSYLAALRKDAGMTQQETADRLGVSNKTISKWESGGGFPDLAILPALAALYGVPADDILAGETVRRIDMMYAMLLPSANDAASVLANDTSGSLAAFAAQMNVRASQLGCTATHFTCPHGLYDGGNYSTARDMAKIALACYANSTYRQIADTASYRLPATELHPARTVTTTNKLLQPASGYYRSYAHGMKTGFTTQAGRCFITFAQQDGHTYGLVILGSNSQNIFREAAELFDWAFTSPELHPAPVEAEPEKQERGGFWHKLFG